MLVVENVAPVPVPPTVARMAKGLSGASMGGSTVLKVGLLAIALGFFAFSYQGCVRRGACQGF